MEQGKNLRRKELPTILQLRYLMELEKLENKKNCVSKVAKACGVNHGSVSRYFKLCHESGYLSKDNEFTEEGLNWLGSYKRLIGELEGYLRRIGIKESEIRENLRDMVENVEYGTLLSVIRNEKTRAQEVSGDRKKLGAGSSLEKILEPGIYPVHFMIYRRRPGGGLAASMANRGFLHPGTIRHNKRGSWLELQICEMSAASRVNGEVMAGHLGSMKYEQRGGVWQAPIQGGRLRIPLDACSFVRREGGEITGCVHITVTCCVGRAHMPESSALLAFWL